VLLTATGVVGLMAQRRVWQRIAGRGRTQRYRRPS